MDTNVILIISLFFILGILLATLISLAFKNSNYKEIINQNQQEFAKQKEEINQLKHRFEENKRQLIETSSTLEKARSTNKRMKNKIRTMGCLKLLLPIAGFTYDTLSSQFGLGIGIGITALILEWIWVQY